MTVSELRDEHCMSLATISSPSNLIICTLTFEKVTFFTHIMEKTAYTQAQPLIPSYPGTSAPNRVKAQRWFGLLNLFNFKLAMW